MLVFIFNGLVFNALYRSDWTLNKLILGSMTYLVSIPKVSTTCRPYTFLDTDNQGQLCPYYNQYDPSNFD